MKSSLWWFVFADVITLHVDIAVCSFQILTVRFLFSHNSHSNTVSLPAVGVRSCTWEIIVCCVWVITDVSEIHMRKTCKIWSIPGRAKGQMSFSNRGFTILFTSQPPPHLPYQWGVSCSAGMSPQTRRTLSEFHHTQRCLTLWCQKTINTISLLH